MISNFTINKTDIIPTVLDGGNEIILTYWPNDKHIICTTYNDIPVKILSHPYVLVNISVLCNCSIEADSHYLLESLAACDNRNSKLTMYFTINTAFANYLEMFPNLTDSLQFPLIKNRTTYEQINLSVSNFDKSLLHASTNLKDFTFSYIKKKEISILGSNFSVTEYIFGRHKLLPILLIWLHLVYGKIFSLGRHLVLMVSEEILFFIILLLLMLFKCKFFYMAKLWVVADVIANFLLYQMLIQHFHH